MALSASLPEQTSPVYCTDEDILVHAGGDFVILCPPWQQMAAGTDGIFAPGAPWVLSSTSVDFAANGVSPNQVIWLTAPKPQFPGGGQLLAIDSVEGNSITLRRPHKDLYVGQPPAPSAGLIGVTFTINTLDPQSEEASFDLKRRFAIDDTVGGDFSRSSSWVYALRDLRMATVLSVLYDRYTLETRTDKGDFAIKVKRIRQQLDDVLARVQVRWGPFGNSAEPSTLFSCKLSR
jgi:hypothetical protein